MMGVINADSFDIFPLRDDYRCSPQSIASHTLYENADPFNLVEPSGTLHTRDCVYEALDDRSVRVRGSTFQKAAEYTNKLEGTRLAGYSTIVPGAIRDPLILRQLDSWLAGLDETIKIRMEQSLGPERSLHCDHAGLRPRRRHGFARTEAGDRRPRSDDPLGLHQRHAGTRPFRRREPDAPGGALPDPRVARVDFRGRVSVRAARDQSRPVYEFHLNHVVVPDSPVSLFPIELEKV